MTWVELWTYCFLISRHLQYKTQNFCSIHKCHFQVTLIISPDIPFGTISLYKYPKIGSVKTFTIYRNIREEEPINFFLCFVSLNLFKISSSQHFLREFFISPVILLLLDMNKISTIYLFKKLIYTGKNNEYLRENVDMWFHLFLI